MKKIMNRRIIAPVLLLIVLLQVEYALAQVNEKPDDVEQPGWIRMMEDPDVGFYEAVTAFETYWANREKPVEEEEVFGNYNEKKIVAIRKMEEREAIRYGVEYKKFQKWRRESLPFVQPDGHILSKEQRLKLFLETRSARQ